MQISGNIAEGDKMLNFHEALLIRDCIDYWLENPGYELQQYEIDDAKPVLEKYKAMVEEHINMAGAMDVLLGIGTGQKAAPNNK